MKLKKTLLLLTSLTLSVTSAFSTLPLTASAMESTAAEEETITQESPAVQREEDSRNNGSSDDQKEAFETGTDDLDHSFEADRIEKDEIEDETPAFAQSMQKADGWFTDEKGHEYFRKEDGTLAYGWLKQPEGWYNLNTKTGSLVKGEVLINGVYYYLDPEKGGLMAEGFADIPKEYALDGKAKTSYFAPGSGYRKTGWLKLDEGWYNLNTKTGSLMKGEALINGVYYYLDPEQGGLMAEGFADIPEEYALDGQAKTSYFDPGSGARKTGWLKLDEGWYNLNTKTGGLMLGEHNIHGQWYYLDPAKRGLMATGLCTIPEEYSVTGKERKCYYSKDGYRQFGWIQAGKDWYNAYRSTGELLSGYNVINGQTYHFDPNTNIMTTGWLWKKAPNEGWHLFAGDGRRLAGLQKVDGKTYYLDPENDCLMRRGLIEVDPSFTGGVKKTVFAGTDGSLRSGEQVFDGKYYYFAPKTFEMITNKMARLGYNKVKFYGDDGVAYTGNVTVKGESFSFDSTGLMEGTQLRIFNKALERIAELGTDDLFSMYNWIAHTLAYQTLPIPMPTYSGYSLKQSYGIKGLEEWRGNCFVYATVLYYMAYASGYDLSVKYSTIYIREGYYGPHGWCETVADGVTYIIDPEGQYEFYNYYGHNSDPYICYMCGPSSARYYRYVR